MESDVITLQDIFEFKLDEVKDDGTVIGGVAPTGLRPTFAQKFEKHGISLPDTLFGVAPRPVPDFVRTARR
jgi:pilus assembly protein CpaF